MSTNAHGGDGYVEVIPIVEAGSVRGLATPLRLWREARSLLTNSLHIMGTTVVTSLLGYVYWVLAARLYSPSDIGLAAALLSAMSLAALLAYMGVGATVIQLIPRRARGAEQSLLVTAAIVTAATSACLGGIVLVVVLPALSTKFDLLRSSLGVSFVLALGVLFTALGTFVDDTTIAQRTASGMLLRNTAFSLLKIGILVLPVCVALGAGGVLVSWVFGAAATVIAGLLLLPRLVPSFRVTLKGVKGEVRRIVGSLAGNHLINLCGMLPVLMLPLIVTVRLDAAQAGYFYTTWRVGGLFFMISPAVAGALFAEGSHNPTEIARKARYAASIIAMLLVPMAAGLIVAGRLVLSAFGHSYAVEGYSLLVILALSAFPDGVTSIYVSILRVRNRLSVAVWLYGVMAVAVLAMTWVLLPIMGITAVGVCWLSTQSAGSLFVWWDSRRHRLLNRLATVVDE